MMLSKDPNCAPCNRLRLRFACSVYEAMAIDDRSVMRGLDNAKGSTFLLSNCIVRSTLPL